MNLKANPELWRATTGLRWIQLRDSSNWVVYNPGSGDVHLLTAEARQLWQSIEQQPRSLDDVLAILPGAATEPPGALADSVRQTMDVMDRAGLIVPSLER